MKLLLMARFTFREALHKRVVHGVAALTVAFLILYGLLVWLATRELLRAPSPVSGTIYLQFTLLGIDLKKPQCTANPKKVVSGFTHLLDAVGHNPVCRLEIPVGPVSKAEKGRRNPRSQVVLWRRNF